MKLHRAVKRLATITLGGVLLVLSLVLGPTLLRTETVRYQWAGEMGRGVLQEPIGVALLGERVYVTDAAQNSVVVFDTAGTFVTRWSGDPLGLARPMHLTAGPDGLLYIADYLNDQIVVVDTAGIRIRSVGGRTGAGVGELDAPGGVGVSGTTLFVADFFNHRVQVFGPSNGATVGRPGRVLPGRLHYPTDVAASDSLLYVADAYNHRIQVFRPDGRRVRRWGGPLGFGIPGRFRGWFRVATGVETAGGRVYVADFFNDRVQIFSARGKYLGQVADSLKLPTDVAVGEDGVLFVADFGHGRVARFRSGRE